jgi:DNA-binding XRE family transcriptional regulator
MIILYSHQLQVYNPDQDMTGQNPVPSSAVAELLKLIGEQIKLARKRRMYSEQRFAMEFGISRSTLRSIEEGKAGVAFSKYIQIFLLMGKHLELIQFASNDHNGKKMLDERMLTKKYKLFKSDL